MRSLIALPRTFQHAQQTTCQFLISGFGSYHIQFILRCTYILLSASNVPWMPLVIMFTWK